MCLGPHDNCKETRIFLDSLYIKNQEYRICYIQDDKNANKVQPIYIHE